MYLVFLTLLLAPRPAQAQWTVTDQNGQPVSQNSDGSYSLFCLLTGNGTCTYPSDMDPDDFYDACVVCPDYDPNLFGGPPPPYLDDLSPGVGASGWAQNNASGNGFYWNGTTSEAINGTMTTSVSTPLTVTFTYTGTGTPPPFLDVLVSGTASAAAWVNGSAGLDGSKLSAQASASDGLGDSVSMQATPSSPSSWDGGQSASGKHLLHLAVSGGVVQVSVPAQFSVTEINLVPCGTGGETEADVNAYASATVMQDNREVTISCPTIEDSYYKGPYEPDHGTDKYDHLRDPATGAIVTDSAVTYQDASNNGIEGSGTAQGWQVNNIAFTANAANFNSPTHQWSLSGPSQAFLTVPTANPVSYSLLEPDSDKFPLQGTLKVTVTDSDGASAANTFGITWHLPYEENAFLGTVYTKHKRDAARVGPVDYGSTLTVKAEGAQDVDVSAVFDAGEAITAVAGQEEFAGMFKIASSLAKITNAKYTYGPENTDFSVPNTPDSGNWTNAGNEMNEKYAGDPNISPATLASDPNGQSLCHLYWYDVEKDEDSSWYADGYNIHGYDGDSQHTIFVRQCDMIEGQPFFVQYKNKDGSPVSGA